ncbi:hypothetical protein KUTeg_002047 [Tegillarca granosa]|uniref:Tyrosine decarboxylase n=1 Tax=Tegillarca granosa TaxID=220873 RepID=A0ABQ9FXJ6_TEGGR|nr:hypothetical protein KUTeg_002047 [Tegillarca granosa]
MDSSEFRKRGKEMVDYIADYMETINLRRVTPDVEPGYLRDILPKKAPKKGEEFDEIMHDVDKAIMPGITHWQHSHFHAYFPAGNSYPSILGDMLSDAIGCVGFSWAASPACTELETVVLDWLGKMIGLPKVFMHEEEIGGGVIQGSASECVLVTLLAAREVAIKQLKNSFPFIDEGVLLTKLVAYSSKLAHSCVEKAGMLGFVKMRQLEVDDNYSLRGYTLERAIEEDRRLGLIPFYVCATLGTTACCSFDNIAEIGEVCSKENVWLHVDAAYAGNALICPEFQYLLKGVEMVTSININPNKWMLLNFDCSVMWYHWGIPLSRRFRSLKLWFVIRSYGVEGLQSYIRQHIRLAKLFETYVKNDARFEVMGKVTMGLGPNTLTQKLLHMINESGKLHMVPALINEYYVIRFAICTQNAEEADIEYAWRVISAEASELWSARASIESNIETEKLAMENIDQETADDDDVFPDIDNNIIFDQQRNNLHRARMRRNLFLRMVSDPKCYNPKVLKALCSETRRNKSDSLDEK